MPTSRKNNTKTKKTTTSKKKTVSKKTLEKKQIPIQTTNMASLKTIETSQQIETPAKIPTESSTSETPSVAPYSPSTTQAESPASVVTEKPSLPVENLEINLEQQTSAPIAQTDTNPTPTFNSTETAESATEETHSTKWIVIIVVLGLLIISIAGGAFYYLTQYKYAPQQILSPQPEKTVPAKTTQDNQKDTSTTELKKVSQSDQVDDILTDIENTNLENLDQELSKIEKEL